MLVMNERVRHQHHTCSDREKRSSLSEVILLKERSSVARNRSWDSCITAEIEFRDRLRLTRFTHCSSAGGISAKCLKGVQLGMTG
jgi:hypothetical protein